MAGADTWRYAPVWCVLLMIIMMAMMMMGRCIYSLLVLKVPLNTSQPANCFPDKRRFVSKNAIFFPIGYHVYLYAPAERSPLEFCNAGWEQKLE